MGLGSAHRVAGLGYSVGVARRNGGWITIFDAASPRWISRFRPCDDNLAVGDLLRQGRTSGLALGWFGVDELPSP